MSEEFDDLSSSSDGNPTLGDHSLYISNGQTKITECDEDIPTISADVNDYGDPKLGQDSKSFSQQTSVSHLTVDESKKEIPIPLSRRFISNDRPQDIRLNIINDPEAELKRVKELDLSAALENCVRIQRSINNITHTALCLHLWTPEQFQAYSQKNVQIIPMPNADHETAVNKVCRIVYCNMALLRNELLPNPSTETPLPSRTILPHNMNGINDKLHTEIQQKELFLESQKCLTELNATLIDLAVKIFNAAEISQFMSQLLPQECKPNLKEWQVLKMLSNVVTANVNLFCETFDKRKSSPAKRCSIS